MRCHTEVVSAQMLVTANVVPSSLMRSSETSVLTRATPRHIPGDGILNSHRHEKLKSYIEVDVKTKKKTP
jgi:hypothetical protein